MASKGETLLATVHNLTLILCSQILILIHQSGLVSRGQPAGCRTDTAIIIYFICVLSIYGQSMLDLLTHARWSPLFLFEMFFIWLSVAKENRIKFLYW